jgi:IS1 family transposase
MNDAIHKYKTHIVVGNTLNNRDRLFILKRDGKKI